ncbi:HD family phosphohydrolase [Lentibacillus salicampi]|uniref:HDIG domain-containing protein n=1 Tax=Lentibacillus salicampi TaxID=175306 RepID=A0A4Y9AFF4_9BACI|nr:HDIG domain-containing metalloprotein [Lentibacillus salicampi]TFJ94082.1 HDIG domain-containing protein [Lentibacillus salicampi]
MKWLHNMNLFIKRIWSGWVVILTVLLIGIFFFLVTVPNVLTETYDIERFTSAEETIRSPVTIENKQETERKTRKTVQSVEDRFNISSEITEEREAYIQEVFDAIATLNKAEKERNIPKSADKNTNDVTGSQGSEDKLDRLKEVLSPEITESINNGLLYELLNAEPEELEDGRKLLSRSVNDVMENGIRAENIQRAQTEVEESIQFSDLSPEMKTTLTGLAEFVVTENSFFDAERTAEARKEAAGNVDPVVIRAGEVIVREGQTITNEIYEELDLVGILDDELNIFPVFGLVLLIILMMIVLTYELKMLAKNAELDKKQLAAIFFISIIVLALMKIVSLYTTSVNQLFFAVPAAAGVLLVKQLLDERLAIVLSILYAILGSIMFNGHIPGSLNVEAGIYFLFSQMAGIIFLRNVKDRLAVLKAGVGMTAINMMVILLFLFLSIEKYALPDFFLLSGYGVIAAFSSVVLTLGLLPFFETGLGILSDYKLLSLAKPNQPLLRKILTEAPGTYHHSVMVANLAETACESIGANGLLARVGAYYHDIGKTVMPHYFIENQMSIKNPHDVLDPKQSADIIINHPYDGAAILKDHKLPTEIVDIAMQHHGTTLLKYFYYKELEKNKHEKEEAFRYPGPKPQTKEAAVICICDAVEAAVRSLKEPTEEKIDEIVASIVNDRLMDEQLNECPLTLKELARVHQTIRETLQGIFHSRIQYPMKEAK